MGWAELARWENVRLLQYCTFRTKFEWMCGMEVKNGDGDGGEWVRRCWFDFIVRCEM